MKRMGFAGALALSLSLGGGLAAAQVASAPAQAKSSDTKDVTLTGCVVKGDGGYVLMNVSPENTAAAAASGLPSSPHPHGMVLPGRVLYWLDDDDELEEHAGQRVEVKGEMEGEIEQGSIEAEREDGLVELEFKVDGDRKVTVKVPHVPATVGTSGIVGDKEVELRYIVRKIDVESVKTLASTCS